MVIRKNNVFTRRTDGSTVTVTDVNNGMITFDDGSRIKSSSLDYAYILLEEARESAKLKC